MAEKILSTRIALKIDTLENWQKSTLPLKRGELALATVAASAGTGLTEPVIMMKVGEDGVKTFNDLQWNMYAKASDVLSAAKSDEALTAYINNVIATSGLATNDAMTTLSNRVTTAEGKITTLEGEMDAVEQKASDNESAISDLEGLVGTTSVSTQIQNAIAALNLANTYDAKGAADQALTDAKAYTDGKDTAMNTRMVAVEGAKHTHANAEELAKIAAGDKAKWDAMEQNAKDYADGLNNTMDGRVSDLEAMFGDGEGTVEAQIEAAVAAEKALREAADTALDNKITAITNDYLKAADKTALQEQITANAGEIEDLHDLVGTTSVATQIGAAKTEMQNALDAYKTSNDAALKAVTDDYLKQADKTELQNSINGVKEDVDAFLAAAEVGDAAVDTLKEIQEYITTDGAAADKMTKDIAANASAIAAEKQRAEGIEGGLETRLATVEGKLGAEGDVAGDIADALAEAKGYTDTEVKELADGQVATNKADIEALEGLVGTTSVSTQITNAVNELKNTELAAMQGEIDAVEGRADALEAAKHTHANKAALDEFAAGDKAKLDTAVQTVTAGTGLTATKSGTDVAIAFDDTVTFVFDCGDSTTV